MSLLRSFYCTASY